MFQLILPEYLIHGVFTILFLFAGEFLTVLINLPLDAFHIMKYMNRWDWMFVYFEYHIINSPILLIQIHNTTALEPVSLNSQLFIVSEIFPNGGTVIWIRVLFQYCVCCARWRSVCFIKSELEIFPNSNNREYYKIYSLVWAIQCIDSNSGTLVSIWRFSSRRFILMRLIRMFAKTYENDRNYTCRLSLQTSEVSSLLQIK